MAEKIVRPTGDVARNRVESPVSGWSRPAGQPVAQRPVAQPAPARVTRPIHGARPDLPDFITRSPKR